jgi:hypothetical protein
VGAGHRPQVVRGRAHDRSQPPGIGQRDRLAEDLVGARASQAVITASGSADASAIDRRSGRLRAADQQA